MYTMKQAAGILGISRQGLQYWANRLHISLEKDEFGRFVISDDALERVKQARESASEAASEVIRRAMGVSKTKKAESAESKTVPPIASASEVASEAEAVALAVLREQIAVKDAQIKSLTAQLESVTEALKTAQRSLEGAQALHAATVKQLQEAQKAQAELEPEEQETETRARAAEDPEEEPPQKKRSFWEWLTGQ